MSEPRLPGPDNRLLVIGQTGTGKSVAGVWHLFKHLDTYPRPWLVFDPKRDKLINSIGGTHYDMGKPLPAKLANGLHIFHPTPETDDDDNVNAHINEAMRRGGIGMYFDEGYTIPKNSAAYRRALTQGRSKHVPIITLSQRPVYMDKFAFTESSFFRVFYLLDTEDRKRVKQNTGIDLKDDLPNYFSHWYDVATRDRHLFSPGPDDDAVRELFAEREQRLKPQGPRWL